jgi:hypothetical protein
VIDHARLRSLATPITSARLPSAIPMEMTYPVARLR